MKKGFTLIEVLVVVAIIGILSAIVLSNYNTSRSKARDARRVSDIGQLQVTLESYFQDTPSTGKVYPAALSSLAPMYISVLPKDPKTGADYTYFLNTGNQTYCVGAQLESGVSPAIAQNTSCTGVSWCTLAANYKICRQ